MRQETSQVPTGSFLARDSSSLETSYDPRSGPSYPNSTSTYKREEMHDPREPQLQREPRRVYGMDELDGWANSEVDGDPDPDFDALLNW